MTPFNRALAALTLMGALASGCSSSDSADIVSVSDAWARPTAPGAENAAVYMEIENPSSTTDRLTGVSSPRCGMAEVHATAMADGVMSMAPATAEMLVVAGDESLVLEPGGLHVMCMGLTESLVEDEEMTLVLSFEEGGQVDVVATVEQR